MPMTLRKPRPSRIAIVGLVLIGLLAWLVPQGVAMWLHRNRCGGHAELQHRGYNHECVGVNDGSWAFTDAFKAIEREILAENQQVDRQRDIPHVSIVMLMP